MVCGWIIFFFLLKRIDFFPKKGFYCEGWSYGKVIWLIIFISSIVDYTGINIERCGGTTVG